MWAKALKMWTRYMDRKGIDEGEKVYLNRVKSVHV